MKKTIKQKIGCGFLLTIIVMIPVIWISNMFSSEDDPVPLTPEEIRRNEISKCFSVWNGSHIKLRELVKSNMNDPNSFEHVETLYSDYGDTLIVSMRYRGKNRFGGVVPGFIKVRTLTKTCDVIQILEQN